MKKLLLLVGSLLTFGTTAWAAGQSYDLPVSSGSGYRTVDVYQNATGRDRQAIVVGDRTSSATVTVDPAGWMNVQLATSTNNIGSVSNTTFTVVTTTIGVIQVGAWNLTNSTVGIAGIVPVSQSGNWNLNNSTVGVVGTVAATQSGNWNLNNSTVGVVGTVAATQSGNWSLAATTISVVGLSGGNVPVAVNASTIAVTNVSGANLNTTVNASTMGVVQVGTWNLTGTTVTIQAPNNNTTAIPISGSISANSVNVSTALFNFALGSTGTVVGGVNSSGLFQTFAVNASSQVQTQVLATTISVVGLNGGAIPISGSISANSVNVSTALFNGAVIGTGTMVAYVGPFGNAQAGRVDGSSNTLVYVTNLSTIQVVATTISVVGINGGNVPVAVNASTVGVIQVGNWNLNNSTVGVVGTVAATQSGNWSLFGTTVSVVGLNGGNVPVAVNASTIAVTNVSGTNLNVALNASTVAVVGLSGGNVPVAVNASTVAVVGISGGNIPVVVNASTVGVQGLDSDNGELATTDSVSVLPAIYVSSRAANQNGTLPTVGRDAALRQTTAGALQVAIQPDNSRYAYAASTNNWTLATTPTDITALCGNSNNTVLVTRLSVSCTQTTAGVIQGSVLKYSTHFNGAWSTMTVTVIDSSYTVTQSTAVWFTANPTRGTEVGHVDDVLFGVVAPGTASPNDIYISPATWRTNPVVLRGGAQCVAFNLEGVTATGGKCSASWSWIEDPSL